MELTASISSVLAAIDSLLVILDDRAQERVFRTEQRQPGSISRALLRTQGRLTSKLPHLADAHLKIMMVGPVANTLERRINEIAATDTGVLPLVKRHLLDGADSLRVAALGARSRIATYDNRARTLQSNKSQLLGTHASLMSRLSGDAVLDQQTRREITQVENELGNIHREEDQLFKELGSEADSMLQRVDGAVQLLSGYVRLGFISRTTRLVVPDPTMESTFLPGFCLLPIEEENIMQKWLNNEYEEFLEMVDVLTAAGLMPSVHAYLRFLEVSAKGFTAGQYPGHAARMARFLFWNRLGVDREMLDAFKDPMTGRSGYFWDRLSAAVKRSDYNWQKYLKGQKLGVWKEFPNNLGLDDFLAEVTSRGWVGAREATRGVKLFEVWVKGQPTANVLRIAAVAGAVVQGVGEFSDEYTRHSLDGSSNSHVHAAVDASFVAAAGYAGGVYGAAIGQVLIPIPIVGAVVGGAIGGYFAPKFSRWVSDTPAFEWAVDRLAESLPSRAVVVVSSSIVEGGGAVISSGIDSAMGLVSGVKGWFNGD